MSAASTRFSPTYNILRGSRLFSIPQPLPPALSNASSQPTAHSDTATAPYPTYQAIETSPKGRGRGEWGLKRPLPLKSTTKVGTPYIRIRDGIDTREHITNFEMSTDHVLTLKKFQALNIPVLLPGAVGRTMAPGGLHSSPFEDRYLSSEKPENIEPGAKRWKTESPWIGGLTHGEFDWWLDGGVKHPGVGRKHHSLNVKFNHYLRQSMIEEIVEAQRVRLKDDSQGEGGEQAVDGNVSLRQRVRHELEQGQDPSAIVLDIQTQLDSAVADKMVQDFINKDSRTIVEMIRHLIRNSPFTQLRAQSKARVLKRVLDQYRKHLAGIIHKALRPHEHTASATSDPSLVEQRYRELGQKSVQQYVEAIMQIVEQSEESVDAQGIIDLAISRVAREKKTDATALDEVEQMFPVYVRGLRASPTELSKKVQKFFDLPDTPQKGTDIDGRRLIWKLGAPDFKKSELAAVTYREGGMPITHPSAGLGYLRMPAVTPNHPIYGPQSQEDPIPARVLKPGIKGVIDRRREAKLGAAGFVCDSHSSLTDGRDYDTSLREFVPQPGGNKHPVTPTHVVISPDGRALINVANATSDKIVMAGLRKSLDAEEYLQRRQNVQSLGGRMFPLDSKSEAKRLQSGKRLSEAFSQNRKGLSSMLSSKKQDKKESDMMNILDDMMSKNSK